MTSLQEDESVAPSWIKGELEDVSGMNDIQIDSYTVKRGMTNFCFLTISYIYISLVFS